MTSMRFLLVIVFACLPAGAAQFFIAPQGNDQDEGSKAKPFATPERAREAVRQSRLQRPNETVTVYLRGGDYARNAALELVTPDSGSPSAPVVWQAYEKEKPRWLGGRRLSGFVQVTDAEVLQRLPSAARGAVVQTDLRAVGIVDFGEMKSRGFARPASVAHCELFFNGQPLTLARWPNVGQWELIAGFPESAGNNDGHGGNIGKLAEGFYYQGERPGGWKEVGDIWVHGYWAWDWANSYERIATLDTKKRLILTAPPHGNYGFRKGQRFYFLNVLEELDQPGEWYLDRASGKIYFWPPSPLEASSQVLLSLLAQPLLRLSEVSHVVFRGVTLEATRGNAIEIQGGASNRIEQCAIRNIGNSAVTIAGGLGHGVRRCEVSETGDGGVTLQGGDRQNLKAAGHFVEDCRFAAQGRWSKCYVPAVLMDGVGLRASHNLIRDHPHCAISFTGNDHLIEFNEIHHIALETGDVGAIYSGRDYSFRGNRIRHNFIHHTGGVGLGSMGVYMDDCVSGTEIFGNVFYKVQRAAFLGGGRDHQVINNVFVECNHAVELDGRGLDKTPVWREMVDKTMRERLAKTPAIYRDRYPALKSLDAYYGAPGGAVIEGAAFAGVPPSNNIVSRNICVGKWLNTYWHATPQMLRLENNLTNAEPGFVGQPGDKATAKDFGLRPDSQAWKLGFERIPVEKIGPRDGD